MSQFSQTKAAGTGANNTDVGTKAWTSFGNITADDSSDARIDNLSDEISNYLQASNFGFTIPPTAVIRGVRVTWDRSVEEGDPTNVDDSSARLLVSGTVSGTNKSTGSTWKGLTYEDKVFGGSSDLWGLTLTPAQVDASNFGAVLAATHSGSPSDLVVDYCEITVWYDVIGQVGEFF